MSYSGPSQRPEYKRKHRRVATGSSRTAGTGAAHMTAAGSGRRPVYCPTTEHVRGPRADASARRSAWLAALTVVALVHEAAEIEPQLRRGSVSDNPRQNANSIVAVGSPAQWAEQTVDSDDPAARPQAGRRRAAFHHSTLRRARPSRHRRGGRLTGAAGPIARLAPAGLGELGMLGGGECPNGQGSGEAGGDDGGSAREGDGEHRDIGDGVVVRGDLDTEDAG